MYKHCLSWLFFVLFSYSSPTSRAAALCSDSRERQPKRILKTDSTNDNYLELLHKPAGFGGGGSGSCFPPLKAISICMMSGTSPFPRFCKKKKKPVEVRPWGELPSNSIQTNRQRVRRRTLSKCERCVPGGVEPVMSAAHGFQTHLCEVRASL